VGTQFTRALSVIKMRGTGHTDSLHPVLIREDGLKVLPKQTFPEGFKP